MYYLFTESGHTPIIVYTSGKEEDARKIHKWVAKNTDYVSESLRILAFSPSLKALDYIAGDEDTPIFYSENDVPSEAPNIDQFGFIFQKI